MWTALRPQPGNKLEAQCHCWKNTMYSRVSHSGSWGCQEHSTSVGIENVSARRRGKGRAFPPHQGQKEIALIKYTDFRDSQLGVPLMKYLLRTIKRGSKYCFTSIRYNISKWTCTHLKILNFHWKICLQIQLKGKRGQKHCWEIHFFNLFPLQ